MVKRNPKFKASVAVVPVDDENPPYNRLTDPPDVRAKRFPVPAEALISKTRDLLGSYGKGVVRFIGYQRLCQHLSVRNWRPETIPYSCPN